MFTSQRVNGRKRVLMIIKYLMGPAAGLEDFLKSGMSRSDIPLSLRPSGMSLRSTCFPKASLHPHLTEPIPLLAHQYLGGNTFFEGFDV